MKSMNRQKSRWHLAGIVILIFGFAVSPAWATTKLRMQSAFSGSAKLYTFMKANYPRLVKEQTKGEIDITMYPAGALAKPLEIFDAVTKGVVDMGLSTGAYHARKVPESLIEFGLPGSFAGPRFEPQASTQQYEFFYEWRYGIVGKMYQDIYKQHKLHLLGVGAATGYGIMTNFPVETLSDLKGKKIRTFGLFSHLIKKLGGVPVAIPNSEQYLSLQRGTIDGTIYIYYALDTYKLKEVVSHIIFPGAQPVISYNCYANQRSWNKIAPKNQEIIDRVFMDLVRQYTEMALSDEKIAVQEAKQAGVKEVFLPESDIAMMKEAGRSLWPVASKKNETSAKLVELLNEYLKEKQTSL